MTREIGKDHKTQSLVRFSSGEGAAEFGRRALEESDDSIDIAGRLGWTTCHDELDDQGT